MAMEVGGISWWEWNFTSNTVTAGDEKSTMLGYEQGEIGPTYSDWTKLIHPDDIAQMSKAMNEHISGKAEMYEADYRIRAKNGDYLWYKDKGGIVKRDADGKPLILSGVVMNITSEKRLLKEKLDEHIIAEKAIRETDQKYEFLFNTLTLGVVFHDTDGKIINVNPAAEKILGLNLSQLKGLTPIDPDWKAIREDGTDFPGNLHPAMMALQTGNEQKNVVMGVYNPSLGQHTWININAYPLFRENEASPYQVYATFEDISHTKNYNN
jgi:PAS domain S-box-containing protein